LPLQSVAETYGITKPQVEPPVQVRIGRVEVRAVPEKTNPPAPPNPPPRPSGFDEFYSLRNYMYSDPWHHEQ
jgi:hypothetical protein